MKILVAPDSFKESLSSSRFCEIAKSVFESLISDCSVTTLPMADGGEGTMEAMVTGTGGTIKTCTVTGPLRKPVQARYGILGDKQTAVVEMAEASGLPLIPVTMRNPLLTTSYGTGELIINALDHGVKKIILALGGSATNDAGSGALQALGLQLVDKNDRLLEPAGESLLKVHAIKLDKLDSRLAKTTIQIASDVTNPLLGNDGATMTYGKQKGGTVEQLQLLEHALGNFAAITRAVTGKNKQETKGAGAAGGMGFGFLSYCNADIKSGFDLIEEMYNLDRLLKKESFNFIITGEGEINFQSVQGKLVGKIAAIGKKHNTPVIAFTGNISGDVSELYDTGIVSMSAIASGTMTFTESMEKAELLLEKKLIDFCKLLKSITN